MQKIKVDVENLQFAVTHFLQASNELKELEYRLKQLGNEFCDDPDLLIVPEYEMIMTHYTELSNNILSFAVYLRDLRALFRKYRNYTPKQSEAALKERKACF